MYAASLSACLMTENNQHNIIVPGCDDQWHGLSVTVKEKATASAADSSVGDGTSSHAPMEVTNGSGPHVNTRVCGKRAWTANPVINIDKLRESLAQVSKSLLAIYKVLVLYSILFLPPRTHTFW